MSQRKLEGMPPRVNPMGDLSGLLPDGVWPVPTRVLEQNGQILIIHVYDHGQGPGRMHKRIWRTLSQAEGISVLLAWGHPPAARQQIQMWDARGPQPILIADTTDPDGNVFRQAINDWWMEATRFGQR